MARPRFLIEEFEADAAYAYLQKHIRSQVWYGESVDKLSNAQRSFGKIPLLASAAQKAQLLNCWGEENLQSKHWQKLKNLLRARRKRRKDNQHFDTRQKTISLDYQAWSRLRRRAQQLNLNLSETIEHLLQ